MDKSAVYELVKVAIGLDYVKLGAGSIDRAIERRWRLTGQPSEADYIAALVANEGDELALLSEEIVVPETWFFRDRTPFEYVAGFIAGEWLKSPKGRSLNVLSFPCSSGEEPYSIAILLKQLGLPASLVNIDAYDISRTAIDNARRAIYRGNAFRGDEDDRHRSYFRYEDGAYCLSDEIRRMVNFRQANILQARSLLNERGYDIVFCRNLLIYLDKASQQHVRDSLVDCLASGGVLVVGHAETALLADHDGLTAVNQRGAFAFLKHRLASANAQADNRGSYPATARSVAASARSTSAAALGEMSVKLLQEAEQLFARGDLAAARYLCRSAITMTPLSVNAFYLLARIALAKDEITLAQSLFQKVLYLDPQHADAMHSLIVCAERIGDHARAGQWRERVARLQAKQVS